MSAALPEWPTLTTHLFASGVPALVGFLKDVFDAEGELATGDRPNSDSVSRW
jgi:hypothetical protein